eukprot:6455733-Amphidinium_carterae.1
MAVFWGSALKTTSHFFPPAPRKEQYTLDEMLRKVNPRMPKRGVLHLQLSHTLLQSLPKPCSRARHKHHNHLGSAACASRTSHV